MRVEFKRNTPATMLVFLIPQPLARLHHLSGPLNAGLAAEPLQRQVKGEGAALAERADVLIVAAPGEAKLQAFVFIFDAEPVAHRLIAVGERERVLLLSVRSMTVAPKIDQ